MEIKCPHCGTALDDKILSQLSEQKVEFAVEKEALKKDKEWEQRLSEQKQQLLDSMFKEKELAMSNAKLAVSDDIAKMQAELDKAVHEKQQAELQRQQDLAIWADKQKQLIKETELQKENEKQKLLQQIEQDLWTKTQELESLKNQIEKEKELAMSNAKLAVNDELTRIRTQLDRANLEKQQAINQANQEENVLRSKLKQLEELHTSSNQMLTAEFELKKRDAVDEILKKKNDELEQLKENFNKEKIVLDYELKKKNEELEQEKNFKQRLNVKLRGEDLEKHCLTEFELHRAAFPYAEFNKDNKVVEGVKSDFVYRDYTDNTKEIEILSILFEMKNQDKNSANKQVNSSKILDKLDKDRKNKNCEYAVLVTVLEEDNPVYESGIVKSYDYEKMYTIRPMHFVAMINMLKDAALNNLSQKKELVAFQKQNVELVTLENRINQFTEGFTKNYNIADKQFNKAILEIDKSIKSLENTKEELLRSTRQLGLAKDKTYNLSIHKLMKDLPLVKQSYEEQLLSAKSEESEF